MLRNITGADLLEGARMNHAVIVSEGDKVFTDLNVDGEGVRTHAAAFGELYDDAPTAFFFGVLSGLRAKQIVLDEAELKVVSAA